MLFNNDSFAEEIYIHASIDRELRSVAGIKPSIKASSETIEGLVCKHFPGYINIAKKCLAIDCLNQQTQTGIAVKTFTSNSTKFICKTEKIAEFNSHYDQYNDLPNYKKARFISRRYNERLNIVKKQYNIKDLYYLVVMMNAKLQNLIIYEFPLHTIQSDNIKLTKVNGKTIEFTDGVGKFNFKMNKSTLYKTFILNGENFKFNFSGIKVFPPEIPVQYPTGMKMYKIAA
jgi:hypothetical protein